MARYSKIYAGPVSEVLPQVMEKASTVDILPGSILSVNADDQFEPHGTAGARGTVLVAQNNYLKLEGADVAIPAGDTVIGIRPLDEQFFHVRVAAGEYVQGNTELASAGDGTLVAAAGGDEVLFYSEETVTLEEADLLRVRKATGTAAGGGE